MASSSTFPSRAKPYHDMEWRLIRKNISSFLVWLLLPSIVLLLFVLHSSDTTTTEEIPSQSHALNRSVTHSAVQSPALVPGGNQSTVIVQTIGSPQPSTGRPEYNQTTSVTLPLLQSPDSGVHGRAEECDLSTGKWVRDSRGSIYTNSTCPTLPSVDNCLRHGKDPGYIYWRWKPDACELPMFEPWTFLRMVRGKKMAFIGDSLARNQMESLLCLLSQAETPKEMHRDEADKFRTWYFPSHDFTLMVMWTQFFVEGTQRVINGRPTYVLQLDKMNKNWTQQLPTLHYAIISGGNWFIRTIYLYEGDKPIGCVFCNEANLTNLGPSFGIRRTLRSALHSINGCRECEGMVTFLRTYSPSHFEHGSWFDGGYCNRTQPLEEDGDESLHGRTLEFRNIQVEEMERMKGGWKGAKRFELLDVTKAIMLRADAHRGALWDRQRLRGSDCLHWCMPGPIDMWNDLLFVSLKRITSI